MSFQFDHRQLADEMEIFFLNEEIGAGLPVWLPNGVAIRDSLEQFVRKLEFKAGYQRVVSPHIGKSSLYLRSGHLRAFEGNMYPPIKDIDGNSEYYLRPMNCPHHHKVFSSNLRSYRQLPLRIAEFGQVYRFENSGSLKGISRVRGLCQNDAHIYVDPNQAKIEILSVLDLHEQCYRLLNLKGYRYRLSKCDSNRRKDFDGDFEKWVECEEILRQCLMEKRLPFFEAVGEAAFYGPKIDVQMKMSHGEEESIASIQLDFNSAEKFDLSFVSESGRNVQPWVIHRAPLGSHERFVSLLLEYFDGALPGWLAPVQLYIIPVFDQQWEPANILAERLRSHGLRVQVDSSGGSVSKRIHFAHRCRPLAKLIMGPNEMESSLVSIQFRDGSETVPFEEIEKPMLKRVVMPE